MVDVFRLAVVGAGRMGRTHVRALTSSKHVRVVAVVEPSEASQAAAGIDVPFYSDVSELLRAGGIDGVLVAAPSPLHLPLVKQLAVAGVPILCEKPCGVSAPEAREAAAIAQQNGVKL